MKKKIKPKRKLLNDWTIEIEEVIIPPSQEIIDELTKILIEEINKTRND